MGIFQQLKERKREKEFLREIARLLSDSELSDKATRQTANNRLKELAQNAESNGQYFPRSIDRKSSLSLTNFILMVQVEKLPSSLLIGLIQSALILSIAGTSESGFALREILRRKQAKPFPPLVKATVEWGIRINSENNEISTSSIAEKEIQNEMPGMERCPKCKGKVSTNATACIHCGARF